MLPKSDYSNELLSVVNSLLIDSESHRLHNFMGNLLQHHAFKSTMYMSKWIEAKNKTSLAFFQIQQSHDKFEVKHRHLF